MPYHELGPNDKLYFEHVPPNDAAGYTFVFFNALTGDTTTWESVIAPRLRESGHGTLAYNMRGQSDSHFSAGIRLDAALMADDAADLIKSQNPVRPILVGLSIGGLFAARAFLQGAPALGLILINTLRRDGPRLQWIGDALVRAAEVGGLDLFRDLFLELLMNEAWIKSNRSAFLKPDATYQPLDPESGPYKLLSETGRTADWNIPYETLGLPTCVITGLQDHVFLETDVVADLFTRLPKGVRVDYKNAGHLIPAECPEALAETLLEFAEGVENGTLA